MATAAGDLKQPSAAAPAATATTPAPAPTAAAAAGTQKLYRLETLPFDNATLRALPVDPNTTDNAPRTVPNACFSRVPLAPVTNPALIAYSPEVLRDFLALDADAEAKRPEFVEYFAGNKPLPGAEPAAHCYCGHQFGYFSGQLGDGAAMYLGEVVNPRTGQRWELQFKGAGPTPYSRSADGRKVLRSSLREYMCSEAMAALRIPTTRAGTIVTSDSTVLRDPFYAGAPVHEKCTVITRVAPTFLRFGSFEIFKAKDAVTGRAGSSPGNAALCEQLLRHTIDAYFPEVSAAHPDAGSSAKNVARYSAWLREVVRRTAELVAHWQCVGWCHGVLNTDNLSVVGVTIDYGPFGFMDFHDPDYICNGSDHDGRYRYKNQPDMCRWNCTKLAEAVASCLPLAASTPIVAEFDAVYAAKYQALMRAKLGFVSGPNDAAVAATPGPVTTATVTVPRGPALALPAPADAKRDAAEVALVESLFATMAATHTDFTNTFRALSAVSIETEWAAELAKHLPSDASTTPSAPAAAAPPVAASASDAKASGSGGDAKAGGDATTDAVVDRLMALRAPVSALLAQCAPQVPDEQFQMLVMIAQRNPVYLAQIGASVDLIEAELQRRARSAALRKQSAGERAAADRAHWAKWMAAYRAHVRSLAPAAPAATAPTAEWSAWRDAVCALDAARRGVMHGANPRYILRNYVAQRAIELAEEGDFTEVHRVMALLADPFADVTGADHAATATPATATASGSGSGSGSKPVKLFVAADGPGVAPKSACAAKYSNHTIDDYAGVPPSWALGLKVTCSS